ADRALVQLAAMLGGDAIEHARGVESAHYIARPLFAFEQPAEENRENLVGIDEAAVFGDGADAVGVAIGGKARIAFLSYDRLLQQGSMRFNGLGINSRKQRIHLLADRHMLDAKLAKNTGHNSASRAVHRVNRKLEFCFGDEVDVGKAAS